MAHDAWIIAAFPIHIRHDLAKRQTIRLLSTNFVAISELNTTHQSNRRNVVFVDDDNITNLLVQRLLKGTACNVHTFTEPDDARIFIAANPVHVLVVDLRMPLIDGIEFLSQLNLDSRKQKINRIIIQTGAEPEASTRDKVRSLGYELILKDKLLGNRDCLNSFVDLDG